MAHGPIDVAALDAMFRQARTTSHWSDRPVDEGMLRDLYDLLKLGPTSANCSPARFLFCSSEESREKLAECASEGNRDKIRSAPVTVIVGMDLGFADHLPRLFPHTDARSWFEGKPDLTRQTAFRNSSLQGAWLIMAARALGLDTGPMSGFDQDAVDKAFWDGTTVETNFLCSLGFADGPPRYPRLPRLEFDEACRIL